MKSLIRFGVILACLTILWSFYGRRVLQLSEEPPVKSGSKSSSKGIRGAGKSRGAGPGFNPGSTSAVAAMAVVQGGVRSVNLHGRTLTGARVSAPDPIGEATFHEFDTWVNEYLARSPSPAANNQEGLARGLELAANRRVALEKLIQHDPQRAIELSLSPWVARQLPSELASRLERIVDARGDLEVVAALPEPGREADTPLMTRYVHVGDETFRAWVYGRRLAQSTRRQIPIHGIAVDASLALREDTVRVLSSEEITERGGFPVDAVCSISGEAPESMEAAVMVLEGDREELLCSVGHASALNDTLVEEEREADSMGIAKASLGPNSWTLGEKKLVLIRVDFSDLPGASFSDSAGTNLVVGLRDFFEESSYGKSSIGLIGKGSAMTPVLRLPSTASFYGTNKNATKLRSDARAAARTAGYDLTKYQLDLICLGNVSGFGWAGLGIVGAAGAWMRGSASLGVAAHELGHNFGLNHANFWDTGGSSVIGSGSEVEYGDKFDTMGSANAGSKHFNARYKNYLNWLGAADVISVTFNGKYRIFPHDLSQSTGARALKIARGSATNYWVEFRQGYTSNPWLMSGVGLRWGRSSNQSTHLLDTTPGSIDGKDDSALTIGRTFSDRDAGVHITLLGKGGTSPESVDVAVYRGFFTGNGSPVVSTVSSSIQASVGSPVRLAVSASDPDGDELAYAWEFGDKGIGVSRPEVTHSWAAAGDYQVRCSVSDMRGGVTVKSMFVRVGSPGTFTVSGRVEVEGKPLAGVQISATSSKSAVTDSEGIYHLVGLSSGTYTLAARLEGYGFLLSGFSNPLRISSSVTGVNFRAIPPVERTEVTLVPLGAVWRYLDDGSDQGASWREPDFDDSGWREGPADLGYGDNDVSTIVRFGSSSSNKHITTYFRREFEVADPAAYSKAMSGLVRDDGAVVYLNGKEVFRSNMPTGKVGSTTRAVEAVGGADEIALFDKELDPSLFRKGSNVLAVEVHQSSPGSTDLRFDLRITATSAVSESPPSLAVRRVLLRTEILWPAVPGGWRLFSAPVLGDAAAWRVVEGAPQSSVTENRFAVPETEGAVFFQLRR